MAKRKTRRGARTQAVRAYMARHPQASAAEIVSALNQQGIKVSAAIVYNLRSVGKRKGSKRARRRIANRSANGAAQAAQRLSPASANLSAEQLLAAKELADQFGGTDALRRTLDLLEKLR